MNYKPYSLDINKDYTRFQFQSVGKRGVFEKVILFQLLADDIIILLYWITIPLLRNTVIYQ